MIDRSLRHVLLVLLVCFGVLFVQLNRIQILDASELRDHPANNRASVRDFGSPRGAIVTSDGVVVARSMLTPDGVFERLREYPEGDLYSHVTGHLSFTVGSTGLEREFNDQLAGRSRSLAIGGFATLMGDEPRVGEIVLSLDHDLQNEAREALGDRRGSVVVLNPTTGAVLAFWSNPGYDPNRLSSHDTTAVNAAFAELSSAAGNPMRSAAHRERYFPGSTFKVVTAAAALESGVATLTEPEFRTAAEYTPPKTIRPISNFGGSSCGGNLVALLATSCNTGFAEMAAELLGPDALIAVAEAFGFNDSPPFDVSDPTESLFPTSFGEQLQEPTPELPAGVYDDTPGLAQSALGQNEVSATPLQMALVAAGIANNGRIMEPHVVGIVRDPTGVVVERAEPREWRRAISAGAAQQLSEAMITAAENGTGRRALVTGVSVGTKTGTAQLGTTPARSHAWTIAIAAEPGRQAELAIAVFIEADSARAEQTGGRDAAPVVQALIQQHFGL